MLLEYEGEQYELIRGSDIVRDGMFLEVWQNTTELLLEAFYSDADGSFTFSAMQKDLPFSLVEYFAGEARTLLPPLYATSVPPAQ